MPGWEYETQILFHVAYAPINFEKRPKLRILL